MTNLRAPILDADLAPVGEVVIHERDGKYFVTRTKVINAFSREISEEQAVAIRVTVLGHDWEALYNFDVELIPWFCPKCHRNYAEQVWDISPRFDPEGHWLDSYRGRCPERHERMIAD